MEKRTASGLFVNDGSFMERFKQLQKEKENDSTAGESELGPTNSAISNSKPISSKIGFPSKTSDSRGSTTGSTGKLAFSLKQKSKLVATTIKLGEDEDEEAEEGVRDAIGDGPTKRTKLGEPDANYATEQLQMQVNVAAPPSPSDPTVKKVADKLAAFVAKHGRQFEHVTRQKNPGNTPFKFLFDESCADFKYYEYKLREEERALLQPEDPNTLQSGDPRSPFPNSDASSQRSHQPRPNYQIPSSALYEASDNPSALANSAHATAAGRSGYGESGAPSGSDPLAMMEFYMNKAAQEERRRQPKQSKDEMPPPASLQGHGKRGHHMGDYIPPEELEKFMANCDDVFAQKAAKETAAKAKIQADNVGHRLLSKMGWKEGEGLGSSRTGIADPIMAGDVKKDHLGVGAVKPGEVTPDDDIYEQYKKRMMLGYKHRPNPLNNPRKSYY